MQANVNSMNTLSEIIEGLPLSRIWQEVLFPSDPINVNGNSLQVVIGRSGDFHVSKR